MVLVNPLVYASEGFVLAYAATASYAFMAIFSV